MPFKVNAAMFLPHIQLSMGTMREHPADGVYRRERIP